MVKKSAIVKQVSGLTLAAKADSDHWVIMDGPKEFVHQKHAVPRSRIELLELTVSVVLLSVSCRLRSLRFCLQYGRGLFPGGKISLLKLE